MLLKIKGTPEEKEQRDHALSVLFNTSNLKNKPLTNPSPLKWFKVIFPTMKSIDREIKAVPPKHNRFNTLQSTKCFYINGILTDKSEARYHADVLSLAIRHDVILLHNPSKGFILDIFESVRGRTLGSTELATSAATKMLPDLKNPTVDKVLIYAHSQGGIIIFNVIKHLTEFLTEQEYNQLIKKIQIITLGSGDNGIRLNSECPLPDIICLKNEYDFVANLTKDTEYRTLWLSNNYGHSTLFYVTECLYHFSPLQVEKNPLFDRYQGLSNFKQKGELL